MPQKAPMHSIEITPQMKRALTKGKGQKISKKDDRDQLFAAQEQNAQGLDKAGPICYSRVEEIHA